VKIIFDSHEPAIIKNDILGWIKLTENSYSFVEAPPDANKINRYLIESDKIQEVVSFLNDGYYLKLCNYLNNKETRMTKVQSLIKEKELKKNGFNILTF
jgi:hypothetical protein